jgi:SPP1 gp7 family putative phage head morphogenesis protein
MTSNEKIFNQYVRHQTLVLRYARGLSKQASSVIAKTEKELEKIVLSATNSAPNRTLTGKDGRNWNSSFEEDVTLLRKEAWDEITSVVDSDLKSFAASEAVIAATIIDGAVPAILNLSLPPQAQLNSIVNSQPFEGRTLKQWLRGSTRSDIQRILQKTKVGLIQGLTPGEITRSVMGTKSSRFKDGVARKAFRDIESIVLTTSNGIQHEAKQALYKANADVIEKEVYVATLDARTTLICASNDGKRFLPAEGPMPPLHFRCRSLRVPDIDPDLLTTRGADPTTEKQLLDEYNKKEGLNAKSRSSLPRGHKGKFDKFSQKRKRELIGTVPGGVTYNDWLKTQSNTFQNEVLGPTRAKLFREGDLHLDKFVARDGDVFTLAELKVKGLDLDA